MAKKRRPIVMNSYKKPSRTRSIVRKAVLITAILAFIEVIILLVIHYRKPGDAAVSQKEEPQQTPPETKETPKPLARAAHVKDDPKPAQNNTLQRVKPATVAESPVKKVLKDTARLPAIKDKLVPKIAANKVVKDSAVAIDKSTAQPVTDDEMFNILNQIRLEKVQSNTSSNCVQVRIVNSSNAGNGSKIANYLRKNGYVISGREVVQGNQKGIEVKGGGPCIKLTIGTL
jgi:hypothetical protein